MHLFELTTLLRGGILFTTSGAGKLSTSDLCWAKHPLGIKTTVEPRYSSLATNEYTGKVRLYRDQVKWLQCSREIIQPPKRGAPLMGAERMNLCRRPHLYLRSWRWGSPFRRRDSFGRHLNHTTPMPSRHFQVSLTIPILRRNITPGQIG